MSLKRFLYSLSSTGIFAVGDSKTDGDSWVNLLIISLYGESDLRWRELPTRIGESGANTNGVRQVIDSRLATKTGTPNYCLLNIGANDFVGGLPVEATWQSDYLYILDAINVKYGDIPQYIVKPWRRTYGAEANTYAGWIDTLVGLRDFAYPGHDERIWLEGGDDGAIMTTDGTHYSAAGEAECANQWKTILGY